MRILASSLSLIILLQGTLFAYSSETNFWKERQLALAPRSSFIGLPASQFEQRTRNTVQGALSQFGSIRAKSNFELRISKLRSDTQSNILLIQDVHGNPDAQLNISRAVQTLIDGGWVDLIALEGTDKPIDLSLFKSFPHQNVVHEVADFLLKGKKISGAVHGAYLASKRLPPIVGVENEKTYRANVEAYRKSVTRQKALEREISRLLRRNEAEKEATFRPALREFDKKATGFLQKTVELGEYAGYLDAKGYIPSGENPVRNFLKALRLEKSIDVAQVERERRALIQKLMGRLTPRELEDFLTASVSYRAGRIRHSDFYRFFIRLCKEKGLSTGRAGPLDSYLRYLRVSDTIDPGTLNRELRRIEDSVYTELIQTDSERKLVSISRRLHLTDKLVHFALTREEWKDYIGNRDSDRISNFDLRSFERFYEVAEIRDDSMAKNLLAAMKKYGARNAILVTGGFHAEGIKTNLESRHSKFERGASIINFVPRISNIGDSRPQDPGKSSYLSVFTQEKTPLEKLFEGDALFLANDPQSPQSFRLFGIHTSVRAFLRNLKPLSAIEYLARKSLRLTAVHFQKIGSATARLFGKGQRDVRLDVGADGTVVILPPEPLGLLSFFSNERVREGKPLALIWAAFNESILVVSANLLFSLIPYGLIVLNMPSLLYRPEITAALFLWGMMGANLIHKGFVRLHGRNFHLWVKIGNRRVIRPVSVTENNFQKDITSIRDEAEPGRNVWLFARDFLRLDDWIDPADPVFYFDIVNKLRRRLTSASVKYNFLIGSFSSLAVLLSPGIAAGLLIVLAALHFRSNWKAPLGVPLGMAGRNGKTKKSIRRVRSAKTANGNALPYFYYGVLNSKSDYVPYAEAIVKFYENQNKKKVRLPLLQTLPENDRISEEVILLIARSHLKRNELYRRINRLLAAKYERFIGRARSILKKSPKQIRLGDLNLTDRASLIKTRNAAPPNTKLRRHLDKILLGLFKPYIERTGELIAEMKLENATGVPQRHRRLLSKEEEIATFQTRNAYPPETAFESEDLRNLIVHRNMRLVWDMIRKESPDVFYSESSNLDDILQEGIIGLLMAYTVFEPFTNLKFSTFATQTVRRQIQAFKRSEFLFRMKRKKVPFKSIWEDLKTPEPETEELEPSVKKRIETALNELRTRDREILKYRFGINRGGQAHSMKETGRVFGIGKERTRQLSNRGLRKLKKLLADLNPGSLAYHETGAASWGLVMFPMEAAFLLIVPFSIAFVVYPALGWTGAILGGIFAVNVYRWFAELHVQLHWRNYHSGLWRAPPSDKTRSDLLRLFLPYLFITPLLPYSIYAALLPVSIHLAVDLNRFRQITAADAFPFVRMNGDGALALAARSELTLLFSQPRRKPGGPERTEQRDDNWIWDDPILRPKNPQAVDFILKWASPNSVDPNELNRQISNTIVHAGNPHQGRLILDFPQNRRNFLAIVAHVFDWDLGIQRWESERLEAALLEYLREFPLHSSDRLDTPRSRLDVWTYLLAWFMDIDRTQKVNQDRWLSFSAEAYRLILNHIYENANEADLEAGDVFKSILSAAVGASSLLWPIAEILIDEWNAMESDRLARDGNNILEERVDQTRFEEKVERLEKVLHPLESVYPSNITPDDKREAWYNLLSFWANKARDKKLIHYVYPQPNFNPQGNDLADTLKIQLDFIKEGVKKAKVKEVVIVDLENYHGPIKEWIAASGRKFDVQEFHNQLLNGRLPALPAGESARVAMNFEFWRRLHALKEEVGFNIHFVTNSMNYAQKTNLLSRILKMSPDKPVLMMTPETMPLNTKLKRDQILELGHETGRAGINPEDIASINAVILLLCAGQSLGENPAVGWGPHHSVSFHVHENEGLIRYFKSLKEEIREDFEEDVEPTFDGLIVTRESDDTGRPAHPPIKSLPTNFKPGPVLVGIIGWLAALFSKPLEEMTPEELKEEIERKAPARESFLYLLVTESLTVLLLIGLAGFRPAAGDLPRIWESAAAILFIANIVMTALFPFLHKDVFVVTVSSQKGDLQPRVFHLRPGEFLFEIRSLIELERESDFDHLLYAVLKEKLGIRLSTVLIENIIENGAAFHEEDIIRFVRARWRNRLGWASFKFNFVPILPQVFLFLAASLIGPHGLNGIAAIYISFVFGVIYHSSRNNRNVSLGIQSAVAGAAAGLIQWSPSYLVFWVVAGFWLPRWNLMTEVHAESNAGPKIGDVAATLRIAAPKRPLRFDGDYQTARRFVQTVRNRESHGEFYFKYLSETDQRILVEKFLASFPNAPEQIMRYQNVQNALARLKMIWDAASAQRLVEKNRFLFPLLGKKIERTVLSLHYPQGPERPFSFSKIKNLIRRWPGEVEVSRWWLNRVEKRAITDLRRLTNHIKELKRTADEILKQMRAAAAPRHRRRNGLTTPVKDGGFRLSEEELIKETERVLKFYAENPDKIAVPLTPPRDLDQHSRTVYQGEERLLIRARHQLRYNASLTAKINAILFLKGRNYLKEALNRLSDNDSPSYDPGDRKKATLIMKAIHNGNLPGGPDVPPSTYDAMETLRIVSKARNALSPGSFLRKKIQKALLNRFERYLTAARAIVTVFDPTSFTSGSSDLQAKMSEWERLIIFAARDILEPESDEIALLAEYVMNRNMGLVGRIFKETKSFRYFAWEEAKAYGAFGLIRAFHDFDLNRRLEFSTYAERWIRLALKEETKKLTLLSPLSRGGEANDISDPNAPLPDDRMMQSENEQVIASILGSLSERERHVILARFGFTTTNGEPQTPDEISRKLNIPEQMVEQIERLALSKLRLETGNVTMEEFFEKGGLARITRRGMIPVLAFMSMNASFSGLILSFAVLVILILSARHNEGRGPPKRMTVSKRRFKRIQTAEAVDHLLGRPVILHIGETFVDEGDAGFLIENQTDVEEALRRTRPGQTAYLLYSTRLALDLPSLKRRHPDIRIRPLPHAGGYVRRSGRRRTLIYSALRKGLRQISTSDRTRLTLVIDDDIRLNLKRLRGDVFNQIRYLFLSEDSSTGLLIKGARLLEHVEFVNLYGSQA